jgi:hypothetical protein
LNQRPDKPTKAAFLTQSTLFKTFLTFKRILYTEVRRQNFGRFKPKLTLKSKLKFKLKRRLRHKRKLKAKQKLMAKQKLKAKQKPVVKQKLKAKQKPVVKQKLKAKQKRKANYRFKSRYRKRLFHIRNNLKFLKITAYQSPIAEITPKILGVGKKFQIFYNNYRTLVFSRRAASYIKAYTPYINTLSQTTAQDFKTTLMYRQFGIGCTS